MYEKDAETEEEQVIKKWKLFSTTYNDKIKNTKMHATFCLGKPN